MEDFLAGFVQQQLSPQGLIGGALKDVDDRRKSKLELKMMSRRIEMEIAAREQEKHIVDPQFNQIWGGLAEKAGVTLPGALNASGQASAEKAIALGAGIQSREKMAGQRATLAERLANIRENKDRLLASPVAKEAFKAQLLASGLRGPMLEQLMKKADDPSTTRLDLYRAGDSIKALKGSAQVSQDVSDSIQALRHAPDIFNSLATANEKLGRTGLYAVQAALNSDSDVMKAIAAQVADPNIVTNLNSAVTLFLFGRAGKTLTSAEKKAIYGLVSAPANDAGAIELARDRFIDVLSDSLRAKMNTGQLGSASFELIDQFNDVVEAMDRPDKRIQENAFHISDGKIAYGVSPDRKVADKKASLLSGIAELLEQAKRDNEKPQKR